jgi:hypothetical protein
MLSRVNSDPNVLGRTVLLNLLLRYRAPRTTIDETGSPIIKDRTRSGEEPFAEDLMLHSLIWRTKCHGVLTPNYDMLLEHAYSFFDHGAALRSYRYNADFLRYIMSNPRFVLKIHGDINDIGRMQFNPETAWAHKFGKKHGQDLKLVYQTALRNGHMIYVGVGFRDRTIKELHRYWRENGGGSSSLRVALMPESEVNKEAGEVLRQYPFEDINVLTYEDEKDQHNDGDRRDRAWTAICNFLSQVVHVRKAYDQAQWRACPEASDIRRIVFQSALDKKPKQLRRTDKWTCRGVPID